MIYILWLNMFESAGGGGSQTHGSHPHVLQTKNRFGWE